MGALISVIIPVYKVEQYLERCLDSVIRNTYRNLEIICVNDGSPDNCQEILERYAEKDERIKVIYQENQGLPAARNTGMCNATGDYFYFLDSDDWIHQKAFEILIKIANENDADVITATRKFIWDDVVTDENINLLDFGPVDLLSAANAHKIRDCAIWVTGRLYSKERINGQIFYDVCCGEDVAYNAMLASNVPNLKYAYAKVPLYYYYQGNQNSIIKNSTVDAYLLKAKWYASHMDLFSKTDYAVGYAFKNLFFYRFMGNYCKNRKLIVSNYRKGIRECFKHLVRNKTISPAERLALTVFATSPALYRFQMILRDPSYKQMKYNLKNNANLRGVEEWEKA